MAFETEGPWETVEGEEGRDAVVYSFTTREENKHMNPCQGGSEAGHSNFHLRSLSQMELGLKETSGSCRSWRDPGTTRNRLVISGLAHSMSSHQHGKYFPAHQES